MSGWICRKSVWCTRIIRYAVWCGVLELLISHIFRIMLRPWFAVFHCSFPQYSLFILFRIRQFVLWCAGIGLFTNRNQKTQSAISFYHHHSLSLSLSPSLALSALLSLVAILAIQKCIYFFSAVSLFMHAIYFCWAIVIHRLRKSYRIINGRNGTRQTEHIRDALRTVHTMHTHISAITCNNW